MKCKVISDESYQTICFDYICTAERTHILQQLCCYLDAGLVNNITNIDSYENNGSGSIYAAVRTNAITTLIYRIETYVGYKFLEVEGVLGEI